MDAYKKITIELTIREAKILLKAVMSHSPDKDDEMIAIMLYTRILNKIETDE